MSTEVRRGYANSYKANTVKSRVCEPQLAVPHVQAVDFYPASLEKGQRRTGIGGLA